MPHYFHLFLRLWQPGASFLRPVNFRMNLWSHRFSQNMNQKLYGFLPCSVAQYRAEILTIFGTYFGRNDDFIDSFLNLLTFKKARKIWWNFPVLFWLNSKVHTYILRSPNKKYDEIFLESQTVLIRFKIFEVSTFDNLPYNFLFEIIAYWLLIYCCLV